MNFYFSFSKFLIEMLRAEKSVVRILTTRQRPSWTVPWQMRPVESGSGSGALILGGTKILTAAHVVADSTYITVQRNTDYYDSERVCARVVAQFHDTDLALLELLGSTEKNIGLEIAESFPTIRSKVNVLGYPVGGDRVSITEGVVSRIDVAKYSHSGKFAAAFTVDAAINAGNSGGPILDGDGKILGVAFQKLIGQGVENQGHGVPAYLIHRFLDSLKTNVPDLPSLGIQIQHMDSPALRAMTGSRGILVNWSRNPSIQVGDVIEGINGHKIDNHGLTRIFGDRNMHFSALLHSKFVNDTVELSIWRDGENITVVSSLMGSADLVPLQQYERKPEYLVYGGLVFQPLSTDYLAGWPNERDRPCHLQQLVVGGKIEADRDQVVVLTNVLASQCNTGYGSGWVGAPILVAVNDAKVKNLEHLVKLVETGNSEFVKFKFMDDSVVVLNRQDVSNDNSNIQAIYDIPLLARAK